MPYIRRRRPECNTVSCAPAWPGEREIAPRPGAAPDAGARSSPTASSRSRIQGSPSCARSSPRSGIPGSGGTDHRRRAHRRARRGGRAGGVRRDPRRRGPAPAAGLPPAGERARRGDAAHDGRGRGPRAPPVRPGRRLRRDDRPARGRRAPRRGPRDRAAPRGAAPVGAQQGLRRRRDDGPRGRRRADRVGAARLPAGRTRASNVESRRTGPPPTRGDRRDARWRATGGRVSGNRRPTRATAEESPWARTSPSSWTSRTSSTRPRRPAWTSTTSCC